MKNGIELGHNLDALEMSRLLIDEYSVKILSYARDKPKSVLEMCEALSIPMTLGYRRVNILTKLGLMGCQGKVLTRSGKWMKIYLSKVKGAFIFFENGKLRMKFELKNGEEKWTEDWLPIDQVHDQIVTC